MKRGLWLIVVLAGALGLAAGIGVRWYWPDEEPASTAAADATGPAAIIGERRPAFSLPNRAGNRRAIEDFDGQVVLVNFWATWCPPCVREMPALDALQQELGDRGLQVVGVALDDTDAVREFAREHDIGYPLLVGSRKAFDLAGEYGNARGTLPYTVVVGREGLIRATHMGALTQAEARALVEPWL